MPPPNIQMGSSPKFHETRDTLRKGFPDPVATLAMGNVWRAEDVEKWIAEHRQAIDD